VTRRELRIRAQVRLAMPKPIRAETAAKVEAAIMAMPRVDQLNAIVNLRAGVLPQHA
jgi:hypothetical protein